MPFSSVELVTVSSGQPLVKPDGTWMQGRLIFTAPDLAVIGAQDVTLGGSVEVTLVDGAFSVDLVATDATGMSPTGWTYTVTAMLTNAPDWIRYITLPKATASVVLADVVVPDPVVGTYTVLADPSTLLAKASNLSDVASASTARTNLGLGGAAILSVGTASGTVAAGDDSRITGAAQKSANLSDLASASTARANLALDADLPSEQGLLAWTYDPNMAGHVTAQSSAGVAGRITLARIPIRRQITWSNIWVGLAGVDTAATLTNSFLGVYDTTGALKGTTADLASAWTNSANAKALANALTQSFVAAPGFYYIALLLNGSWTTNTFTLKASLAGSSTNANLSAPNLRYANMLTGQTSLPSSLTLASQTTTIISTGWGSQWYGVS